MTKLTRLIEALAALIGNSNRCACSLPTNEMQEELLRRGIATHDAKRWVIELREEREIEEITGEPLKGKIPFRVLANWAIDAKRKLERGKP